MFYGAGIIPVTADGKILLQLRSDEENNGPQTWGSFGGGINTKVETFEQGAIREFCEETGSDPSTFDPTNLVRFMYTKRDDVRYLTFLAFVTSIERFPLNDINESAGYGWFDLKDPALKELKFFEPFKNALLHCWDADWPDAILTFLSLYGTPEALVTIVNITKETAVKKVPLVKPINLVKLVKPTKEVHLEEETKPVKEEKTTSSSISKAFETYNIKKVT